MDMLTENVSELVRNSFSNEFAASVLRSDKYGKLDKNQENILKILIENTQKDMQARLNEGTLTADVAQFTPIVIPMIRRLQPNLIANELLGVQPMSTPTGFIYALTNQYLGDGRNKVEDRTKPAGVIYEIDYKGSVDIQKAIYPGIAGTETMHLGTAVIKPDDNIGESHLLYVEDTKILCTLNLDDKGQNRYLTVGTKIKIGDPKTDGSGELDESAVECTIKAVYTNESSFGQILPNFTGPYKTTPAEHLGEDMREVGFSISRKAIEVQSRKLKGKYTVELFQDLKSQHGLNADEELMNLMQYETQAEIDRECVGFVKNHSTWLPDTAFFGGEGLYTADVRANSNIPVGRWEIERYRAEVIRMSAESAKIGIDTKRGQGNILLVSPMVATMLEQVGSFQAAPVQSDLNIPVSGGVAGTFDNKYKVVIDQYAKNDFCTVLYKGINSRDAMGFYCPYVPLSFTKVTNYESGQPVIIANTRYALTTTPGISDPNSDDRSKTYARSFGINFKNTILQHYDERVPVAGEAPASLRY